MRRPRLTTPTSLPCSTTGTFFVLLIAEHLADLRDIGIRLHGDGRLCGNNHDVHIKQFCVRQFREFAAGHASDQCGNVGKPARCLVRSGAVRRYRR